MANHENSYTGSQGTGTGNAFFDFTFPTYTTSEVRVEVDNVVKTLTTHYTVTNYNTTSGGKVRFTTGNIPTGTTPVRIFRQTNVDAPKATFTAGSALKAGEINDNFKQLRHALQEAIGADTTNRKIQPFNIEDGAITSAAIKDLTVARGDIANDAIDGTKIADDSVDSEHFAADSIDTEHYAPGSIDATAIGTDAVTRDKIFPDAIDSTKIADNAVNSEHYVDGSIDHEHLANDIIDGDNIQDDVINSEHYVAGSIDHEHLANDIIDGDNIQNDVINSEHYVAGSIDHEHLANDIIDGDNIQDDVINSEHYVAGSIDREHLAADIVDGTKIADDSIDSEHIAAGALDNEHYAAGSITSDKLNGATVITAAEQGSATTNDTSFLTSAAADARFFNISSGDTIKDGDTFPDNDTTIATTAAINDRIIDLVDDVGGFVPIANETSFPTSNPDVNNGTGTLISIKTISSTRTPSGGGVVSISNGTTTGNNTVTIQGCGSTVLTAGFGVIVETTGTLHTYSFHRLVPKATEVTTVAGISGNVTTVANNIADINTVAADLNESTSEIDTVATNIANVNTVGNAIANVNTTAGSIANVNTTAGSIANVNTTAGSITNVNTVAGSIANVNTVGNNISQVNSFANLYRIASSDPQNNNDEGDLYFNTTSNELRVYNGSTWQGGVTATGNLAGLGANTFTGNQTIQNTSPKLLLTDSDSNSDFSLWNSNGNFRIYDETNAQQRMVLASDGTFDFNSNVDFNSGIDVTGNITVTGTVDGVDIAAFKTSFDNLSTDIVNDTTPQLGGSLDTNTKNINFGDSNGSTNQARFGAASDLKIYHSGTGSYIDHVGSGNGHLFIRGNGTDAIILRAKTGENSLACHSDGDVSLYYDGVEKLETRGNGVKIIDDDTDVHLELVSSSGSNGHLYGIDGTKLILLTSSNEYAVECIKDGAVNLYHNGTKKFETTSGGASVTGNLAVSGSVDGVDISAFNTQAQSFFNNNGNGVLTNGVTATTQSQGDNSTKIATTAYTDTAVSNLVDSAPGALNTLNELAAAIGDDANFSTTITNSIATKLPLAGGQMTGNITMSGSQTVDGRDLSVDGAKLDGIASSANNYSHPNHSGEVTSSGDGAMTIADNVVDEANLKVSNSPTNGYFLSAQSGNTGGLTWAQVTTDLVGDTSPQLGGNLDTNDKLIQFGDATGSNNYTGARFGDDDDLWIYHTPGNLSVIRQNTSGKTLVIQNAGGDTKMETLGTFKVQSWEGEDIAQFIRNGGVKLYYDNNQKLETTNTGVTVTGTLAATAYTGDGSGLSGVASAVADGCIYENSQTISNNYTITTNKNALSAGPITIANGAALTIPNGSVYTIV